MKSSKFKIQNYSKGFTLVELLAVIVVVVAVSAIVGGIITTSLRGANKTNSITDVQQSGNFALSQMTRMVQFAKAFNGASTDGVHFSTDCTQGTYPTPTPSGPLSCPYGVSVDPNGTAYCNTQPLTQYRSIAIVNPDSLQTVLSCIPAAGNTPATVASQSGALSPVSLLDTTTVVVSNCYFTCTQQTIVDAPTIGINFTLNKLTGPISFFENTVNIKFQTTVTMRNNNR